MFHLTHKTHWPTCSHFESNLLFICVPLVCRENELRLRLGEDQVTSSVQVCEGDSWCQSIEAPLRIPATTHAPRNVRVTSQMNMNGFFVIWELGTSSTEMRLLSHEVTCSSQDRKLTISATADGPATSVSVPVQPSPGMLLECCVVAMARRSSTIGALVAEECATLGDGVSSMSPGGDCFFDYGWRRGVGSKQRPDIADCSVWSSGNSVPGGRHGDGGPSFHNRGQCQEQDKKGFVEEIRINKQ